MIDQLLPKVQNYLDHQDFSNVGELAGRRFTATALAQGEYNLNYLITDGVHRFVFRVNIGTQIGRSDQILYEYQALELLEKSGVTPKPVFVDNSRQRIDQGISIMEYLPGEPLDYRRDLRQAAGVLARIHQVPVPAHGNPLIREDAPLSLIYNECAQLLQHYLDSELADPRIKTFLAEVLAWADDARARERFYQQDPWPCIVNTEVNSGNFIVNREKGTLHLIDWEMPRYGDPSQDLAHFCSPMTTLWKTDYRITDSEKTDFIRAYLQEISDAHLKDTLDERIRLREPFVWLRGICWSAMGWVAYQSDFSGIQNQDTWQTLCRYLRLEFIRSIFDPVLGS
jgi:aminoglycoside phosphotransferase (APT) family kinase protein